MAHITTYDTTLRDGGQCEGINFSLNDKLLIARALDDFGVDVIEGHPNVPKVLFHRGYPPLP